MTGSASSLRRDRACHGHRARPRIPPFAAGVHRSARGPRRLALVGDAPYRMDVGAEDLTDANNAFGEAGFLISWVETRKAKRGLS